MTDTYFFSLTVHFDYSVPHLTHFVCNEYFWYFECLNIFKMLPKTLNTEHIMLSTLSIVCPMKSCEFFETLLLCLHV